MTAAAAQVLGVHVGQVVPLGAYTNAQANSPGFGTPSVAPHLRIDAKLVGIVVLNNQVVQDDVDRLPAFVLFTPALTRPTRLGTRRAPLYGLQLDTAAATSPRSSRHSSAWCRRARHMSST